jgi:hypothetical protein
LLLAAVSASSATSGCGGEQRPVGVSAGHREPEPEPPPRDAAADQEPDAVTDVGEDPEQAAAVTRAVEAVAGIDPATPADNPAKLRFRVIERGPELPWLLVIVNDGRAAVDLAADPRLLWFEVVVPGTKKPTTCRLPNNVFPDEVDERSRVRVEPGSGVVHQFDPRLYCFGEKGQTRLIAGSFVTPRFGWKPKTKTVWKKGKPEKVMGEQKPPFAAELVGQSDAPGAGRAPLGIKWLEGEGFALASEYVEWSPYRLRKEDDKKSDFVLDVVSGSDAQTVYGVTVGVKLRNVGKRGQHVFFRRELVSFEVMGPSGVFTCDAQPDDRAPDRQAFARVNPGGAVTESSRLAELCPQNTFAQPGLYLVHARFDATQSGNEYGLRAFMGTAVTDNPGTVRVRKGDVPLADVRAMHQVALRGEHAGSTPPAAPSADAGAGDATGG